MIYKLKVVSLFLLILYTILYYKKIIISNNNFILLFALIFLYLSSDVENFSVPSNNEIIQQLSSVYNNGKLIVNDLQVTNKLEVDGTTSLKKNLDVSGTTNLGKGLNISGTIPGGGSDSINSRGGLAVSFGTVTINRSDTHEGLIVNAKGGIESNGNIVSKNDIKASNEIFVKDKNLFKSGLVGCPPKFYDKIILFILQ